MDMMVVGKELAAALVKCQSMVEGAKKGKKNDHFRSKYADLGAVLDACSEALSSSGLAVLQFPTQGPPGTVGLRTVVVHETGQSIEDTFYMPLKDSTNPQAVGSALTYARRYSLMAALGIAPEDDDGNAAARSSGVQSTSVTAPKVVDTDGLRKLFISSFESAQKHGQVDKMKAVYTEVRSSQLNDDDKTQLLSSMGETIKGMGKKNG